MNETEAGGGSTLVPSQRYSASDNPVLGIGISSSLFFSLSRQGALKSRLVLNFLCR